MKQFKYQLAAVLLLLSVSIAADEQSGHFTPAVKDQACRCLVQANMIKPCDCSNDCPTNYKQGVTLKGPCCLSCAREGCVQLSFLYHPGQTYAPNPYEPCTICTCQGSTPNCSDYYCAFPCPKDKVAVPVFGDCCPDCLPKPTEILHVDHTLRN